MTFLIPSESQRPWSPPVGFQCVYESYFQDDTKLWFPIPQLVTSYVRRRGAAISQFLNGSWRIAVALMVMAAEIYVTLSVRAFKELTSINPLDEGLLSIKMQPNYNVIGGHPRKTLDLQRSYFYVKSDNSAFEDPPDEDYQVLWNTLLGRTLLLIHVNASGTNHSSYFVQPTIRLRASMQRNFCRVRVQQRDSIKSVGEISLGKEFVGASPSFQK